MEKRQQMALLQELEEQKAKLEQMLQEAQQEREQLKAAVTQEQQLLQPQVPVQDQVQKSSASEGGPQDESIRRLRDYQRRLLEQNRCVFLLQMYPQDVFLLRMPPDFRAELK